MMVTEMIKRKLSEHGALVEAKGRDGVFPIRIITEGKGSSGVYSRELLKEYADVFANRAMHLDHPADPERPWERSVAGIAARTGNVEYREVDGVGALFTEAKVRKEYREFVEEFGDLIGVSIYASGTGREEDGEYIVESFDGDDPYTSVDFVVAAGRGGRVEKMMESYRAIETSVGRPADDGVATANAENEKMGNHMDEKILALVEALATKVDALDAKVSSIVTLSEQAIQDAAEKVDAFEVVEEVVAAVAEAKLPEEGRKRVIESVKAGNAVAEAVAAEKAYVESIRKSLTEGAQKAEGIKPVGRVIESAAGADDFTFDVFEKAGA